MEPRGCNRWQPIAKRLKQAKTVAVGCDQLPRAAETTIVFIGSYRPLLCPFSLCCPITVRAATSFTRPR
jgi:hypothetical protein